MRISGFGKMHGLVMFLNFVYLFDELYRRSSKSQYLGGLLIELEKDEMVSLVVWFSIPKRVAKPVEL